MKKPQWLLIGITIVFVCLVVGIFIGRNLTGSYLRLDNAPDSGNLDSTQQEQKNDGRIDLNTATQEQLQLLPGIGEVTAQKILDYRTEHGGFTCIEDLMNISGIGEKKFEQMKPYVKVGELHENSGS